MSKRLDGRRVVEVAPHNVQVNATGQIFVENPTYFPPEYLGSPELNAGSDEVAQAFRDDLAQRSDLISPGGVRHSGRRILWHQ
jgi:hypothetical protein